jgi:enoyl-CoA hydratase
MTDLAAAPETAAPLAGVDADALTALRLSRDGAVLSVALAGPGKGNAMGPDLWAELPLVFRAVDADPDVRAVVLSGSGRHFTVGLDLMAMADTLTGVTGDADGGLARARTAFLDTIGTLQDAVTAVAACRKPVVAAVHGWCIGGGVDLIAACDVRVASADAQFSVREVKVAIVADLGSLQRLPHLIGEGWTRRLALTGEDIDASVALRIGLVSDVLPDQAAVLAEGHRLAQLIAANPPLVVQGTKQVLEATRDLSVADGLRHVAVWNAAFLHSKDLIEAVTAFLERRPPVFEGR